MKNYLAKTSQQTSTSKKKYAMFVGRWQPWHDGHRWLVEQALKEGKRALICIRDVEPDEKNPWTAQEIENVLKKEFWREVGDEKVKVIIIPDIESINIGRSVGYDVIEYVPPDEISSITATEIRERLRAEGKI